MSERIVSPLLGALLALVGASALASGAAMMLAPSGKPLQMPPAMLEGSPFADFFLPGLLLFGVIGLGHAAAAALVFRKRRLGAPAGAVMGIGLMIWIFVQVNMIGGGHWLQYLYFALGTAETVLAVLIMFLKDPRR